MDSLRKTFFVRPDPRGWLFGRGSDGFGVFSSKALAIVAGKTMLKANEGASLFIFAADGRVAKRFLPPSWIR